MINKLPSILLQSIGLKCSKVRETFSGGLQIGFGKKIYHKQKKNLYHTEWEFITSSAWRYIRNNRISIGSMDFEEENSPIIKDLLNRKLTKIISTNNDITLEFDNAIMIEVIGISTELPIIEVFCPNSIHLELNPNKYWIKSLLSSETEGLTKEEELVSIHSEECSNRWQTPMYSNINKQCLNCAYYLPLRGRFHFWDYGICSNNYSSNDGKLVNVKSGCEFHKEKLSL